MTEAHKEELKSHASTFNLEEQGILVTQFDAAVLMEELRFRYFEMHARLGAITDTANGGTYIYGQ